MRRLRLLRPRLRLPWALDAAPLPAEILLAAEAGYRDFLDARAGRSVSLEEQLQFRADLAEELMPEGEELRRLAGRRGYDRVYLEDVVAAPQPIQELVARRVGLTSIQALAGGGNVTTVFYRRLRPLSGRLRWTELVAEDPERLARFAGASSVASADLVPALVLALTRLRLVNLCKRHELDVAEHNRRVALGTGRAWSGAAKTRLDAAQSAWEHYVDARSE